LILLAAGPDWAKNQREKCPRPDSDPFNDIEFGENPASFQDNSPQSQIADSNSINAVSLSSARTMKRFPWLRCASAIQICSGRGYGSFLEAMNQIQNLVNCIKIFYEAGERE
jgi:hypothetical protein